MCTQSAAARPHTSVLAWYKESGYNMDQQTLNCMLHVLNVQLAHCKNQHSEAQDAYYRGLRVMADIVLSSGYTEDKFAIVSDDNATHKIWTREAQP